MFLLFWSPVFQLSPALRNRFTEIWCGNLDVQQDLGRLLDHNLFRGTPLAEDTAVKQQYRRVMTEFAGWFAGVYPRYETFFLSPLNILFSSEKSFIVVFKVNFNDRYLSNVFHSSRILFYEYVLF